MSQNERIRHEKTPQGIQTALDTLAEQKPALSSLISAFGPVLAAKAEVTAGLSENAVNTPDLPESEWARFSRGVHLFAITGLMDFHKEFKHAASTILSPMAAAFPGIQSDIEAIQRHIEDDSLVAEDCVWAYVQNFTRNLNVFATLAGTTPDIFRFAMAQIAEPFKQIQARAFSAFMDDHPWPHGHCPMCGSFPTVAAITGEQEECWLQCAVCAHEWHFRSQTCPRCENNNQGLFEHVFDPDNPAKDAERVTICKLCNTYILTTDLRGQRDPVNMDVTALGMTELDIQAREKGYSPQSELIWNLMEYRF